MSKIHFYNSRKDRKLILLFYMRYSESISTTFDYFIEADLYEIYMYISDDYISL